MPAKPEPFRLAVEEAAIADLRERLARIRFPDQAPGGVWTYGAGSSVPEHLQHSAAEQEDA